MTPSISSSRTAGWTPARSPDLSVLLNDDGTGSEPGPRLAAGGELHIGVLLDDFDEDGELDLYDKADS